jgi:ketosteroid isomerase-like protein
VSDRKDVVARYIDGFRRTDHDAILACITDDIEWVIHGYRTMHGKDAFDAEIENDAASAQTLELDRLVEEGDTVVGVGHGSMILKDGGPVSFVFSEVFTFSGERISRIETFHMNLADDGSLFAAPTASS